MYIGDILVKILCSDTNENERYQVTKEYLEISPYAQLCDMSGNPIDVDWKPVLWFEEVPRGWTGLMAKFFSEFKEIYDTWDEDKKKDFYFFDIKEKYGSLIIYPSFYTLPLADLIEKYRKISKTVCTICGKSGVEVRDIAGWYGPMCDKCYNKVIGERG